jgi:hypothetical protein
VIVRISMEDQYRLPDADAARLNELDNAVVAAVEAGDSEGFRRRFAEMIELVRTDGVHVPDDELVESDLILPPADLSFEEAGHQFNEDGLIPE